MLDLWLTALVSGMVAGYRLGYARAQVEAILRDFPD